MNVLTFCIPHQCYKVRSDVAKRDVRDSRGRNRERYPDRGTVPTTSAVGSQGYGMLGRCKIILFKAGSERSLKSSRLAAIYSSKTAVFLCCEKGIENSEHGNPKIAVKRHH